jgi:hypothetical protein
VAFEGEASTARCFLREMMGIYMTQREAISNGFTHHGRMFSVPCWVTDDGFSPMVAPKFAPFELWISVCTLAIQLIGALGADVAFPIQIGPRIETNHG